MKKVCHIISGYYRNDPRIFQRQSKSLYNNGFSVSILTNDGEPDSKLDGISFFSVKKYNTRLQTLLFAKRQFCKKAIEINCDFYLLHSPELLQLGIYLKKNGKFVLYDAHEDLPRHIKSKKWVPFFLRSLISIIFNFYYKNILKKYDAIITPHSHVCLDLLKCNKNVIEITNFSKISNFNNFSLSNYLGRDKIICYSGTAYSISNQDQIFDAITNINLKYKLAGFLDPIDEKRLSKHSSYEKFQYIGRLPYEQLSSFYNDCIIGLVILDYNPNWGGKHGTYAVNKIFEYMASALPIICSDYKLWQDIVDKYNCGIYVEPGNVEQITNAILKLYNDPHLSYIMGQNGRNAVMSEYNWDSQELKYIDIFNNL